MDGYAIFGIILLAFWGWIVFEIWRAPMMEEKADGSLITKKPAKEFKDLFKKKK